MFSRTVRFLLPLAGLAALCPLSSLRAQAYTPPTPALDAPCKPTKKDPCTTPPANTTPPAKGMAFPFPGDTSDAVTLDPKADPDDPANKPAPSPSGTPASGSTQPGAGQTGTGQSGADGRDSSGKFPFPGEAPASGSSSSSSGSDPAKPPAEAADDDDPPAPAPTNRRHLPKVEDTDAREAKDIDVADFYFSKGDFQAAYNRGKDAIRLMPEDPEAHFVLAQAATKLGKSDEAREEYKLSLKFDVSEDHAKVARQALAQLH